MTTRIWFSYWEDGNYGAKFLEARDKWQEPVLEVFLPEPYQSEYHGGPCCSSCYSELEDGYGSGFDCCCHDGQTPLENHDYDPKYPPVNGKLPEVFEKWGPRTQKRYLARFEKELIQSFSI